MEKHFDTNKEELIYEKICKLKKNESKNKFFIPLPPPNITGKLHMGHALGNTIQDFMIRYNHYKGKDTLFLPGTDHAGIATEEKVLDHLKSKKIMNPTKEEFYIHANSWQKSHKEIIYNQMKKLGLSCDWENDHYTLSDEYKKAAISALKICHENKMLYKENNDYFLDMRELASTVISEYHAGNIKIIPEHKGKTFLHFLENIEPWNINRQIHWGLQLPIYSNENNFVVADTLYEAKKILGDCNQEEDVFDTWFTSSLWPFVILGWPNETKFMDEFYPASLIETGEDILFFWCARMLMMGLLCTNTLPFKTIVLHGMIRDKQGRKMSKSLGNGIDPLDIISKFGCDSLRYGLLENNHFGLDLKLKDEIFVNAKKFTNKIWQISRFLNKFENKNKTNFNDVIITKLNSLKNTLDNNFDNYELNEYCINLKKFFWDEFCSSWIEENKSKFYSNDYETISTGYFVLFELLQLLSPIMPFITNEIKEILYK